MSAEQNKAIVLRMIEEGVNQGNESVLDELVSPTFRTREGDSMQAVGLEGFKELVASFRSAFPDGKLTIEEVVAEGNKVVTWGYFIGTHIGPLEGMPPTGKQVKVNDVDLYWVENGKVVESWTNFDQLGMMQQLGALGHGVEEE